jgi:hypothetical protein
MAACQNHLVLPVGMLQEVQEDPAGNHPEGRTYCDRVAVGVRKVGSHQEETGRAEEAGSFGSAAVDVDQAGERPVAEIAVPIRIKRPC